MLSRSVATAFMRAVKSVGVSISGMATVKIVAIVAVAGKDAQEKLRIPSAWCKSESSIWRYTLFVWYASNTLQFLG